MQICFVTIDYHTSESGGGIGSYLTCLSEELVNMGFDVSIICAMQKNEPAFDMICGVKIHRTYLGSLHYYISKIPLLKNWFTLPIRELEWSYALWRKARELCKNENFDIIESCETGNFFTMIFPRSCPWVIRAHGATYSFKKYSGEKVGLSEKIDRLIQRYCMKRASALSAPSVFQANQIEKEISYKKPVASIANPVHESFFDTASISDNGSNDKKIILYTGRIEIRKGTLVLLKAMKHIVDKFRNVELIIVGGRHVSITKKMLEDTIASNGIGKHVKLMGHVEWSKMQKFYADCDIFAIPSYWESFCISAAEAMALGKPVVGTSGTALPELIDNGVTGLIVPPGDEKALAKAVLKLLNDHELAKQMGSLGRLKIIEKYQVGTICRQTLVFYNDVLKKYHGDD